jgi:hypothetical protein
MDASEFSSEPNPIWSKTPEKIEIFTEAIPPHAGIETMNCERFSTANGKGATKERRRFLINSPGHQTTSIPLGAMLRQAMQAAGPKATGFNNGSPGSHF